MKVEILHRGIVQHDCTTKQDSLSRMNPVFVKPISHRIIAEIERRKDDRKGRKQEYGLDEMPCHELLGLAQLGGC